MISIIDIKRSYINLLKELYKDIKIYGLEVTEGYIRPAFFITVSPVTISDGLNVGMNVLNVYTTYLQKEVNEIDIYRKIDEIRKALGLKLKVNDRQLNVEDFTWVLIGEDKNILQLKYTLEFFDVLEHNHISENNEIIKNVIVKEK